MKYKTMTILLCLLLILTAVLPMGALAEEEQAAPLGEPVDRGLESLLLSEYLTYGNRSRSEVRAMLAAYALTSPRRAEAWRQILCQLDAFRAEFEPNAAAAPLRSGKELLTTKGSERTDQAYDYDYLNGSTEARAYFRVADGLLEGLPQDDSLCIVVLGYALNKNGSMQYELAGRLSAAAAYAKLYPNARIMVTGGGTASKNKSVTEASAMAEWLISTAGIDKGRFIFEDEAMSTVGNAQKGCSLLREQYPQIRNLLIITSDYHIPRGVMFFLTEGVLNALEQGLTPYNIVGYASYDTAETEYESLKSRIIGMCQILGIDKDDLPKVVIRGVDNRRAAERGK